MCIPFFWLDLDLDYWIFCPATTMEYKISCFRSLCCFMVRKVLENAFKNGIRYGKFDVFISFFYRRSLFYGFARRESHQCVSSYMMIECIKMKIFCSRKWGKNIFSLLYHRYLQHSAGTASIFSLYPSCEPYANVAGIKKLNFAVYGGAWQQVTGISPTTSREVKIK